MKNKNAPKTPVLRTLLEAAGLAMIISLVTISYTHGYEINKTVIALAINLIVSFFLVLIICIMGESFIEDIIKAVIISFLGYMIWISNKGRIDLISSFSLSIIIAAWYPVLLKMLLGENP